VPRRLKLGASGQQMQQMQQLQQMQQMQLQQMQQMQQLQQMQQQQMQRSPFSPLPAAYPGSGGGGVLRSGGDGLSPTPLQLQQRWGEDEGWSGGSSPAGAPPPAAPPPFLLPGQSPGWGSVSPPQPAQEQLAMTTNPLASRHFGSPSGAAAAAAATTPLSSGRRGTQPSLPSAVWGGEW
jgi:hypothetical protein